MFWFSLIFRQEKYKYWDDAWPFTFTKACSRDRVKLHVFTLAWCATSFVHGRLHIRYTSVQIFFHFKVNDSQGRKDKTDFPPIFAVVCLRVSRKLFEYARLHHFITSLIKPFGYFNERKLVLTLRWNKTCEFQTDSSL